MPIPSDGTTFSHNIKEGGNAIRTNGNAHTHVYHSEISLAGVSLVKLIGMILTMSVYQSFNFRPGSGNDIDNNELILPNISLSYLLFQTSRPLWRWRRSYLFKTKEHKGLRKIPSIFAASTLLLWILWGFGEGCHMWVPFLLICVACVRPTGLYMMEQVSQENVFLCRFQLQAHKCCFATPPERFVPHHNKKIYLQSF
jgi:hypothetical protein